MEEVRVDEWIKIQTYPICIVTLSAQSKVVINYP